MNRLLLLAFLLLPLAGCLSNSTAPTDSTPTAPAPTGHDEKPGAQGDDGSPAPAVRGNLTRKEVASLDFKLNSLQPTGPLQVQVPQGAVKVLMKLDYQTGAYQDAGFTLGECHNVSPVRGMGVSANGSAANVGGSTTLGVLYDCGAVAAGPQNIAWTLTGTLEGRLTLFADLPA